MSELSPRARAILHSGRALNQPTDADRIRVGNALRARLGAALSATQASKVVPVPRPHWPFVATAVVGVGLVGSALFLASRQQPVTPSAAPAATPVIATSSAPPLTPALELPSPDAPKAPALVASERATASTRPTEDRLAQEVALLARATSSLHAGRPADALKVLDEYQHRFPKGLLTEERRAARAQALCSLGRQSEAQAELARLAPHSPSAARAKQVCDAHARLDK